MSHVSWAFPRFALFSQEQCEAVHHASLEILRRTGVRVHHARALALLGRWDEVERTLAEWEDEPEEASAKAIVCGRLALWSERPERLLAHTPPPSAVSARPAARLRNASRTL